MDTRMRQAHDAAISTAIIVSELSKFHPFIFRVSFFIKPNALYSTVPADWAMHVYVCVCVCARARVKASLFVV